MRDLLLYVNFSVHVELHNTDSFSESDVEKMMDRIQKAVEQDTRCALIIDKPLGGFMHRILYQEREKE